MSDYNIPVSGGVNGLNVPLHGHIAVYNKEFPVIPNPEGEVTGYVTKLGFTPEILQVKDPEVHDWARAEEKPTYTKAEVGLGNVDNTSDLNKPISTATQTALDGKVDKVPGKALSTNDYTDTDKAIVDGVTSALATKVDKIAGKGLSSNDYTDYEKTKLAYIQSGAEVNVQVDWFEANRWSDAFILNKPTKLSDFSNDTGFITSTVDNLTYYYKKSETYTQAEVNALIGSIVTISFLVVQELPQMGEANIIYLVPADEPNPDNIYEEYIYVNDDWEMIGTTKVDLSNYYTKTETNTLLNGKVNKDGDKVLSDNNYSDTDKAIVDGLTEALNGKADKSEIDKYNDAYFPYKYVGVNGLTFTNNGYIDSNGAIQDSSGSNWKYSDAIKVDEGTVIDCVIKSISGNIVTTLAAYDSNMNFLKNKSNTSAIVTSYTVPSGVTFIRFCKQAAYTDNWFTILEGAYKKGTLDILDDINNKVNIDTGKNLICIGDSYGIQNTGEDITKFFWEYLKDALNLTEGKDFFEKYIVGSGFGNGGYLRNIQLLETSVSDKSLITDIFVSGGWNDSNPNNTGGTDEEFWEGAEEFCNYCKTTYPNATVTIAHISWGRLGEGMRDQLNLSLNRYKELANTFGCRFLTNMEYVLHIYDSDYWQTDSAHPNEKGQKLLGKHIVSAFLSGSADVHLVSESSNLITYGFSTEIVGTVYSEVTNNKTRIWSNSENGLIAINGFVNNGMTPSGAIEYAIGKINTSHFRGYKHFTSCNVGCLVLANSKYYIGTAKLRLDNDILYARFYVPHDYTNTWLGGVTNIYINDFEIESYTLES